MDYYLLTDASGTVIGSGATPDGTIPDSATPCTQEQAANPKAYAISSGGVIDAPTSVLVAAAQAAQLAVISQGCRAAIYAGFQSSALGAAHTYPASDTDQRNLIALATASLLPGLPSTWTAPFWCADSTGAWSMRQHTAAQIQKAGSDGQAAITSLRLQNAELAGQVMAATTVSAVQAIVWTNPA